MNDVPYAANGNGSESSGISEIIANVISGFGEAMPSIEKLSDLGRVIFNLSSSELSKVSSFSPQHFLVVGAAKKAYEEKCHQTLRVGLMVSSHHSKELQRIITERPKLVLETLIEKIQAA